MYGGHIVEDWDRRLANAYLFKYFNETLLEGMEMFPAFFTPANTMTHKQVYWQKQDVLFLPVAETVILQIYTCLYTSVVKAPVHAMAPVSLSVAV